MSHLITVYLSRDTEALNCVPVTTTAWPELRPTGLPRHPSEMGGIADALVTAARASGSPRIVVTHSEVFVLRLRRRVAEGSFKAEELALIWVESGVASPIPVLADGDVEWWPKNVFSEDYDEAKAIWAARREDSR